MFNQNSYKSFAFTKRLNACFFFTRNVRHLTMPNQPNGIDFPKRLNKKGTHGRSFQVSWFKDFNWLHYDEQRDAAFCFTCLKAAESKSLSIISLSQTDAFTKFGFTNWKTAMERERGFRKHENTNSHREAVARYIQHTPANPGSIIDHITTYNQIQKKNYRRILYTIISNIRYLGR